MLYIASDHGGFKMKQALFKWLQEKFGDRVKNLGPSVLNSNDDYPKFAGKVAREVSEKGKVERVVPLNSPLNQGGDQGTHLGILLCRSGQGVCIVANKFQGVRAALAWNVKSAKASRHDDHANILCLPTDYISVNEAKKIITAWLETPWGKEKRHERRVKEIDRL